MAFELPAIRTKVFAMLQDDASFITTAERNEAIDQAVLQVNHDKPLENVVDIAGDDSQDYGLESPFSKQFSDMKFVETPADENPPVFRNRDDDWFLYENPTKTPSQRLRFLTVTPKTTEVIRVTFTSPHTVTESASDLNQTTFLAVVYKSLVFLYRALAARFAQTTDPTIVADAVDYGGRSQNFLFLATRWEDQYKQIIGFGDGEITAAQAIVEGDIRFPWGEDFLFHGSRTR